MSRRFPAPHLGGIGERVRLDAETSHHLLRVCLTPRGTVVRLFHEGSEAEGVVVDGSGGIAVVELTSAPCASTHRRRVLIAGLTRKPAWERTLRMGTELGVTEFRPFLARHSVAKGEHLDRWRRIVSEAARQSERSDVPEVHGLAALATLVDLGGGLVLTPGAAIVEELDVACLIVGPEGGLHREELELALAAGFVSAGLGDGVLRADTACVAALARYTL